MTIYRFKSCHLSFKDDYYGFVVLGRVTLDGVGPVVPMTPSQRQGFDGRVLLEGCGRLQHWSYGRLLVSTLVLVLVLSNVLEHNIPSQVMVHL